MRTTEQDVVKTEMSPVLFMTVDGEPMSFFLRPGPVKLKLQPLITSGGGMLCKVQQPGAILLMDPEEKGSIPETAANSYVSIQYIYDCIERDEQLNVEDYRLNPEVARRQSSRLHNRECSPGLSGGRVAYTPEDDAAILNYVSKRESETGGNRLWQEMKNQRVTNHSWQSMKYRYRVKLAKKQSVVEEVKAKETEEETKEENKQETNHQTPPSDDTAPGQMQSPAAESLQTQSAETDLTQIDVQPIPAGNPQPENVDAETSNSAQLEEPRLDPQTDAPAESAEPKTAEPQAAVSPQREAVTEDSPQSLPNSFSPEMSKEQQRASPEPEQPQRRGTRRQLELEASPAPEPHGKKLRSSSTSSSPQSAKKTRLAVKAAVQKQTIDPPPSKRARGRSVAAEADINQEESEEAAISETPQPEEEPNPTLQEGEKKKEEGGKKKEKRQLGILELATKEFEDESEASEDDAPNPQNPAETVTIQPTATQPTVPPPDTATDPAASQSNPEPRPSRQEREQQTQVASSDSEKVYPDPAAAKAVQAPSRAHLFIFDSESQEEDSQSLVGDGATALANQQPHINKGAAPSLTQVQLEEDVQRLRELMKQTNQDAVSVTKALLKASGDISAARDLLTNPSSFSRPFWSHCDDDLLSSADPDVRQQLHERYGEMEVAKRIVFLELEG